MSFEPELGQLLTSGGEFHTFETPKHILEDLHDLAERIGTKRGDWGRGWGSLTSNSGAEEFVNDVFALRSYCWCEGEGVHEDECPPNFEHFASGLSISWYKHAGRGTSMNQELLKSQWRSIFDECVTSVGVTEEQVLARRREESDKCQDCGRVADELLQEDPENAYPLKAYGLCLKCEAKSYLKFEEWATGEEDQ